MPIKKSYLEQKWYYRIAKVLFWIIPFLAVLVMFLVFLQDTGIDILQEDIWCTVGFMIGSIVGWLQSFIVNIAIGLALYFLILKVILKIFFYIVFGGVEDDMKKKDVVVPQSVGSAVQSAPAPVRPAPAPVQDTDTGSGMGIIVLIVIIVVIASYFMSESDTQKWESQQNNSEKNSVHRYCDPGYTYNTFSSKCCPNSAPYYYPGREGVALPGCYASCPYVNACGNRFIKY